jgi:hypothetical protein
MPPSGGIHILVGRPRAPTPAYPTAFHDQYMTVVRSKTAQIAQHHGRAPATRGKEALCSLLVPVRCSRCQFNFEVLYVKSIPLKLLN